MFCLLFSRPVMAQEEDKIVTPLEMFEPERGDGLRIAPNLLLFPSLEIDATYDDNVYNEDQGKIDDVVASVRPRLTLRSDFSRHAFRLSAGADVRRYADVDDENSEQYDIHATGTIDLAERTELIADAGFRRGIEQRGTAGDQFLSDKPVSFDRKFAGLQLRRQGGFLELMAEGRIAETDYNDARLNGVPIDLSSRDATVKRGRIRGSAPSSHYSRVFLEASLNQVSYEQGGPIQRGSNGFALLAGMLLKMTQLVDLEVGAGYIQQNFDNPAFKDVKDFNYLLKVDWTPKPDWEFTAAASRRVDPSPRIDVPAIVASDFSLEARKAIGDRTLVSAEVGYIEESYRTLGRKDKRIYAAAGAHHRLTDNLGLIARASWRKQDGNNLGRDYDGIAATVGVRLRF